MIFCLTQNVNAIQAQQVHELQELPFYGEEQIPSLYITPDTEEYWEKQAESQYKQSITCTIQNTLQGSTLSQYSKNFLYYVLSFIRVYCNPVKLVRYFQDRKYPSIIEFCEDCIVFTDSLSSTDIDNIFTYIEKQINEYKGKETYGDELNRMEQTAINNLYSQRETNTLYLILSTLFPYQATNKAQKLRIVLKNYNKDFGASLDRCLSYYSGHNKKPDRDRQSVV